MLQHEEETTSLESRVQATTQLTSPAKKEKQLQVNQATQGLSSDQAHGSHGQMDALLPSHRVTCENSEHADHVHVEGISGCMEQGEIETASHIDASSAHAGAGGGQGPGARRARKAWWVEEQEGEDGPGRFVCTCVCGRGGGYI